jgi:hypothetical protein
MYNVPIPSITDKNIIAYLQDNNLISPWNKKIKNDEGEVIRIQTVRPTYRQLCSNEDKWKHDQVFEWHEQFFDERGNDVGKSEKKLFSIHTYGRFFYNMTPSRHQSIFEQLKKSKLSILLDDGEEKLYYDQHIQTPDEFFKKIVDQTMLEHIYDEKINTIRKVQRMLSTMLKKYPTFAIHIDFLKALKISLSYSKNEDGTMTWDNWYLDQIIEYVPYLVQRPFFDKEKNILPMNGIYAYHLITYQTLFFEGKRMYLTDTEIDTLCGRDLKKVYELTPAPYRVHYRRLNEAKQRLVRKCFSDVQGGIEKNHEEFVQELIAKWLEEEKYTKKTIQRKGIVDIKNAFRKKYGKGWKSSYISKRISAVIDDIDWWDKVEDTDSEDEEESFMRRKPTRYVKQEVGSRSSV